MTPENLFVSYSFDLILSGLLACVVLWRTVKQQTLVGTSASIFLLAALAGLSCAFFACSYLSFHAFVNQRQLFDTAPENVSLPLWLAAVLLLGVALTRPRKQDRFPVVFLIIGVMGGLGDAWLHLSSVSSHPDSAHWLALALLAALLMLQVQRTAGRLTMGRLMPSLVMGGLCANFALLSLSSAVPEHSLAGMLDVTRHVVALVALIALARIIEIETEDLFSVFFLRLNITFIVLAGFIIVVVSHVQRQQFVAFAENQAADLMEFIRGHVMYYHQLGRDDLSCVSDARIERRIVSEFGRIPSLRSVAVVYNGVRSAVMIDSGGLVERAVETSYSEPPPADFAARADREVLSMSVPIYAGSLLAGWVEVTQINTDMNRAIVYQIVVIFTAFTVVVVVSAIVAGILVSRADRTIRRQYREIKETHQQLDQAGKMAALGELAGGVAHEVNNPIGVIVAHVDYMSAVARKQGASQELLSDLEMIRRNATRAAGIVRALLDFARPRPVERQVTDLNALISATLGLLEPLFRADGVKVMTALQDLPAVSVDRDRIQQAFVNLLKNAVDSCERGGHITVSSRYDASRRELTCTVADDGAGMPAEVLPRIYDPFFTTKPRGTGLGLSLTYGTVRDHGGMITVKSEPGKGAAFTVVLPGPTEGTTP
ncbi:MAG: hypothetical protein HYV63_08100 [Candidatus Schekmanbacteria bacterium]|nr:hypothetical protein [Candidatus Schekmanbacteria bacterium]